MAQNDADFPEEIRFYSRFENKDEFVTLRDQLLAIDIYTEPTPEQNQTEAQLLQRLSNIVRSF